MTRKIVIGAALIALAALVVSIWRFNHSGGSSAALTGDTRADFVRSAIEGCSTLQKASPDNAGVEPATIASYCDCYANDLAGRVTSADLDALRGRTAAEMQATMRPKMAKSEAACFAKLDEKP